MRIIILTFFVSAWFTSYAQNGQNQLTEDSLKIGEWVYYYDDGKIATKEFYRIENRRISAGEAFFAKIDLKVDSIRKISRLLWKEHYEYFYDGQNLRITRHELGKKTEYYFGENKDLMLLEFDTILCNRSGIIDTIEFNFIKNKSCDLIDLSIKSPNKDTIKEQLSSESLRVHYTTPIKMESGFTNYEIFISCYKTIAPFMANSFGYDLTTADFQQQDLITLNNTFSYYRTGNETLLKVYKKKTSEPIQVISIAQDKKEIEIEKLKSGKCWFSLVDFSNNKQYWKRVKLKNTN